MEINPRLSLKFKDPHGLFRVDVPKHVAHYIEDEVRDNLYTIKIKLHQYIYKNTRMKNKILSVVCFQEYYQCPHCALGGKTIEKSYAIDVPNRKVYPTNLPGTPANRAETSLMAYTTKHKHPYDLSSFTAVAVYPVSWLTYHDTVLIETNKLAKRYLTWPM